MSDSTNASADSTPGVPLPPAAPPVAPPPAYQAAAAQPASYGHSPADYGAAPGSSGPKTLSLISMITGIVGVAFFGFLAIASIAAIILGFLGRKREPEARAFWLTGLITGFVGLGIFIVGGILLLVFWLAFWPAFTNTGMYYRY